jgi:putative peptidoglycan lipid II flippase
LSASFIPVYAKLLADGERETADRVAGAVAGLMALVISALVLGGVLLAPALTVVLAPGFTGGQRELTILLVRILFPGAGLLVLSAWCLGVLNSHRRFLLSYAAPVMWNAAMIVTLVAFGPRADPPALAIYLAWGSVAGSALQLIVQLPAVWRVAPSVAVTLRRSEHVRAVARTFVPAFVSRGVVQVSAFIDTIIASLLPTGAITGLANAQLIYTLPVSLFGLSVAAAELPAMAGSTSTTGGGIEALRHQLNAGLRRIAFFVVPSAVAFLAFGDVIAAALLQTGRFRASDAVYVWGILAGSAVGLMAATLGRLYASAYYALRDTTTPLRYALLRVGLGTILGYTAAIHAPGWLGVDPRWGAAGLTMASGITAWIEMGLLRTSLSRRIGATGLPAQYTLMLWSFAVAGAGAAWLAKDLVGVWSPIPKAALVLGLYGALYLLAAYAVRIPEVRSIRLR